MALVGANPSTLNELPRRSQWKGNVPVSLHPAMVERFASVSVYRVVRSTSPRESRGSRIPTAHRLVESLLMVMTASARNERLPDNPTKAF